MQTNTAIEQTTIEGRDYYTAVRAGVEYTAMKDSSGWGVATRRLALGRFNTGGFKRYPSLAELAHGCRAFRGLDALVDVQAVAA